MPWGSIAQIDLAISGAYYALIIAGTGIARVVSPPATSSASGISGYNIAFDSSYLYACTGTNLWGRVALANW